MFVLDCSVLVKSFLEEDGSPAFRDWWAQALRRREPMHVPALAVSEVARVIQRERPGLPVERQRELWHAVLLGLSVAPADTKDGAWGLPGTYHDAEYVALATRLGARLVTADRRQAEAAGASGVPVLDFVPR